MDGTGIRTAIGAVVAAARNSVPASAAPATVDGAAAVLSTPATRVTGPVADALAAGRLLRTGSDDALDQLEGVLLLGRIDDTHRTTIGAGMNGTITSVHIHDPLSPSAPPMLAVEKSASAQAAQEELGWRLARAMGIDYLVAAAMRRADGTARIVFKPGESLSTIGIRDADQLERVLSVHYVDHADALGLTADEAAQAARIDRQMLQVFDYLLANIDRHSGNARYDAVSGAVSFVDSGHAARGALAVNGGTTLEPALRNFQAGLGGGTVELDTEVVELLRARLTPARIRGIHAAVYDAKGIAGPEYGSYGERFLVHTRADSFREGIVARFQHVLDHGSYTHRRYDGDAAGDLAKRDIHDMPNVQGLRAARAMFDGF